MKKPDELVVEIERSVFGKAIVISLIAHLVLMGATSLSLFRDWTYTTSYEDKDDDGNTITRVIHPYLLKSPSYINAQKSKARHDEEELARKKAAAEKAAAAEAARAAAATNKTAQASAPVATNAAAQASASAQETIATQEEKRKTPPEVQPLPPKKDFQYGEDLSLD